MDFEDFKAEFEAKEKKEEVVPPSNPMGVQENPRWRCPRCTGWVIQPIGKVCHACRDNENALTEDRDWGLVH